MSEQDEPKCDKCGAPLFTAMMAVFCPHAERCEFWPTGEPENEAFIRMLKGGRVGDSGVCVVAIGGDDA